MKKDRILITKEMIPYSFNILLGDELFTLAVNYNDKHDFFTIALEKDNEILCEGEPVVYGHPLFSDIYEAGKFPCLDIIPTDESGKNNTVTFNNFNETVFLTVDNFPEEEQDESTL